MKCHLTALFLSAITFLALLSSTTSLSTYAVFTKFIVWASDPFEKIFKDTRPPSNPTNSIHIDAVRNEYVAAQFAIRAGSDNIRVRLRTTSLEGPDGAKINFSANFVGFVPVRKNTPNTPPHELIRLAPFDAPDPILELDTVTMNAGETQPVWVTVFIPENAPHGLYRGKVEILSDSNASIEINLQVYPVTLTKERTLWFSNWFFVQNIAIYHDVKLWSEEHWNLIEKYAKFMADHRQNVIKTPLFVLIKFIRQSNGSLKCDFSRFDRWVELFKRSNVIGLIEGSQLATRTDWKAPDFDSYTIYVYHPNGSLAYILPSVKASSVEFHIFLSQFLPQLQDHLERKGWINQYVQHLADEPSIHNANSYKILAGYVRELAPKLRIIEAASIAEIEGALDFWVPVLNEFDRNMNYFYQRKASGEEVWFYTSQTTKGNYPNRFIDYSLIKIRILHWLNFRYNLSGYLHWGFNSWSGDPFHDVEPRDTLPGDAFIIYPGENGPLSSIRFEMQRLGVQDYELLKMLDKKNPNRARILAGEVVRSLTDYEKDPSKFYQVRKKLMISLITSDADEQISEEDNNKLKCWSGSLLSIILPY